MTTMLTPTGSAWPALDTVPHGPRARISAAVARRIFVAGASRLGISWSTDGSPADLVLHRPDEFFTRLGSDGLIGFGESYLTGAWDAEDLAGTLTVLCREIADLVPAWMQRLRAAYVARPPRHHRGSEDHTRDNIAHHYDLSNDLFATFLDPTLSYSAAMFDTDSATEGHRTILGPPARGSDLAEGQARKIERILDAARVGPGSRVLEIGTGWGELALRAAARGATVRTVTLSQEQLELARERVAAAGYGDRVSIELLDYRLIEGEYDAVVSVEMIEAVGDEYWSEYFRKVDDLLVPGGRFALQAITMPHQRMLDTRDDFTWIKKYIFPGGLLPSVEAIEEITRRETALRVTDRLSFGQHYAETLRLWDETFRANLDQVRALGFDPTFLRMWHFYLAYCQGGFAAGYTDVQQMTFVKEIR